MENGQIKHEKLEISGEEPLKAELSAFIDAVQQKGAPLVSGLEAREALAVALKITRQISRVRAEV